MLLDTEYPEDAARVAAWKQLEQHRPLTERLVALVQIPWFFAKVQFRGEGTRKHAFELFDEILCGLLLAQEGLSGEQLRKLLGLDDDLGNKTLDAMLRPLLGSMIAGDSSYYALTERGRTYAKAGSKYKPYAERFELVVDMQASKKTGAHDLFALMGKTERATEKNGVKNIPELDESLRKFFVPLATLLPYVQVQSPKMHLPEKGFYLEKSTVEAIQFEVSQIWIGVVEDLQTQQCFYEALTTEGRKPLPIISALLSESGHKQQDRINEAVTKQYAAELVDAPKAAMQLKEEEWMLEKAKTLTTLPPAEKTAAVAAVQEERKTFSTHAFEDELDQVSKTCQGELWIISPWVRAAAFEKRKVQIERVLKQGGKVFIGYSAPHEQGQEMMATAVMSRLKAMQSTYDQLFVAELPQFHEKIMFVDLGNGKRYEYTGSFNVMSFAVGRQEKIGRENMRRLKWGSDCQSNYDYQRQAFTDWYLHEWQLKTQDISVSIPNNRPEISKVERQWLDVERQFASFFSYVGGEVEAQYVQQVQAGRAQVLEAKKTWMNAQLAEDTARIKATNILSASACKDELKKANDRLRELVITEADVQVAFAAMRKLCHAMALQSELDALLKRLAGHPAEWIAADKFRYEKELSRIRAEFPNVPEETIASRLSTFATLVLEKAQKAQATGLKVVGKVGLPAQASSKPKSTSNKKKKNKKR